MARAEIGLLEVQLLGEFTLRYGGERVVVGKNSSPRFLQLLQLLWLKGEEGLTKAQIMNALYETDTLTNVNNSFNNLVYQMRKQMIAAGLPDEDYIVRRRGIYIPDRAVPLKVDVQEFRDYMDEGDRAAGDEGRVKAYKAAAEIYTGELLPDMPVTPWIVEESIMLKALYERCVSWLAGYYRREGMTEELLKLYRRASAIYQDNDWKAGEIDVWPSSDAIRRQRLSIRPPFVTAESPWASHRRPICRRHSAHCRRRQAQRQQTKQKRAMFPAALTIAAMTALSTFTASSAAISTASEEMSCS